MSKKAKLSQIHNQLNQKVAEKTISKSTQDINPAHGSKGDFFKITVTMSGDMLSALKEFGIKRKMQRKKGADTSSIIREAVQNFLDSQDN